MVDIQWNDPEYIFSTIVSVEDITDKWFVEERWLSDLNISLVSDGDNSTCLDLTDITTILTLQHQTTLRFGFYVKVVLSNHLEKHRHSIVRVLTSGLESNSCPNRKQFMKCIFMENHTYSCFCSKRCQLSVKMAFVSAWAQTYYPHEVCEIRVEK